VISSKLEEADPETFCDAHMGGERRTISGRHYGRERPHAKITPNRKVNAQAIDDFMGCFYPIKLAHLVTNCVDSI
jgi:hypothetical protein